VPVVALIELPTVVVPERLGRTVFVGVLLAMVAAALEAEAERLPLLPVAVTTELTESPASALCTM